MRAWQDYRVSHLSSAWKRAAIFLLAASLTPLAVADSDENAFFESKVRPLLIERCVDCHGPDEASSSLRLDRKLRAERGGERGPAWKAGDPKASLLIQAVAYHNIDLQMPPDGRLPDEEIAILTDWIARGAHWPTDSETEETHEAGTPSPIFDLEARRRSHWAWQPITAPATLPKVQDEAWGNTAIDRWLLAKIEAADLAPAPPAERAVRFRRLSFDLMGLPPNPDDLDAFLADSRPDAWERAVDRMLASPHFGERWARHWLDLVRFAESLGHEADFSIANAYRYRDYVIRAINADVPIDQFFREHLAGDLVEAPRRNPETGANESVLGTGFYWFGDQTHSPVDLEKNTADRVDNQIDVLGKTFLGLTIACARCHDHKFDAISARDFYALAGVIESSHYRQLAIDDPAPRRAIAAQITVLHDELREELVRAWSEAWPIWMAAASSNEAGGSATSERAEAWQRWLADAPRTAQFEAQVPPEYWVISGDDFAIGRTKPGDLALPTAMDGSMRVLVDPVLDSRRLARRFEGAIRSPGFTIEKRYLHVRAAGQDARIQVIVNGFHLVRPPIYGDLKRVLNSEALAWHTFDLDRWRGLPAFVEVLDQTAPDMGNVPKESYDLNAWFRLGGVVFSDEAAPSATVDVPLSEETWTTAHLASRVPSAIEAFRANQLDRESAFLLDLLIQGGWLPTEGERIRELRSAIQAAEERIPPAQYGVTMADSTPRDVPVAIRGNPRSPGPIVPRRFLEAIQPEPFGPGESGRRMLAERIVDPSNPLTARVFVNRIWLHLYGRGLVATPDNFGVMGELPSHPELLDHLADEFLRDGWSLKRLIRRLVTTNAYQMSSRTDAPEADPDNRLFHRANLRRLEGEAIRDAILALSGRLDPAIGGPSVPVHLTAFMEGRGRPGSSGPLDGAGRRSVYLEVRRNFPTPFFVAFDQPPPATAVGRRSRSNVPAQALLLLNDPFVHEQAARWGAGVCERHGGDAERIRDMFLAAYARLPGEEESRRLLDWIGGQQRAGMPEPEVWASLAHAILNSKEFWTR